MNTVVKMRNIGPKSAAWLRQVGVRSEADIKRLGALEVFMKVRKAGFRPSLNLLYALEGAVQDCHWTALAAECKSELVLAVNALEEGKGPKSWG
ncbi:MAG: transcriptional regulator, partial [Lysobacterales bacterium CG02_land_8_20_14_3_00_62_12]